MKTKCILTHVQKKFSKTWHTKQEIRNCGRAANANLIRGAEGPRGSTKTVKSPADAFEFFITGEILQEVVRHANKKITNFMTRFYEVLEHPLKYSYGNILTDLMEIKALIELLYLRPCKHTMCIPGWNDVETTVLTSFWRGINTVYLQRSSSLTEHFQDKRYIFP